MRTMVINADGSTVSKEIQEKIGNFEPSEEIFSWRITGWTGWIHATPTWCFANKIIAIDNTAGIALFHTTTTFCLRKYTACADEAFHKNAPIIGIEMFGIENGEYEPLACGWRCMVGFEDDIGRNGFGIYGQTRKIKDITSKFLTKFPKPQWEPHRLPEPNFFELLFGHGKEYPKEPEPVEYSILKIMGKIHGKVCPENESQVFENSNLFRLSGSEAPIVSV